MNIDFFNEALELRNKVVLCEDVLKYLSGKDAALGQKYKETLALFAKTFEWEFMYFVHQQLEKCSIAFDELHCCPDCECENKPAEETPFPEDSKFKKGDRVRIVNSIIPIFNGRIATVEAYDTTIEKFGVRPDGFSQEANLQWYADDEIELYTEEENPDESKDEKPEGPPSVDDFAIGDKVKVIETGAVGEVYAIIVPLAKVAVVFNDGGEREIINYYPDEIQKIDEDGGAAAPDEGE